MFGDKVLVCGMLSLKYALQFLLSLFTFVIVCTVKCEGIPKFISQLQIPVVLCFGFNCSLLRVIP